MLQEQMVSTGQGDKTSARDAGGELAPGFDWNDLVVPHMHDERRRLHFGEQIDDIEIVGTAREQRTAHSGEVVFSCSALKVSACSCVAPGMKSPVNICRKVGLSAPHPIRIKVLIARAAHGSGRNAAARTR